MNDHLLDVIEPIGDAVETVRLGTRRSVLARTQSVHVARRLAEELGWRVEIAEIVTEGDVNMTPLAQMGGTGVFVSAVRMALETGAADIAVHSLKDLPTAQPPHILLAAIPVREDPRDVLISLGHSTLAELAPGSSVGTGSPRRAAQLRGLRPDLDIVGLRGNIDTRLGRVAEGDLSAIVLAGAGLRRVGREAEASEWFDDAQMLPAPGQGALAIECRAPADDRDRAIAAGLARIDHAATRAEVTAERSVLSRAEAGCSAPIGARGRLGADGLQLTAVLADQEGVLHRRSGAGTSDTARELGAEIAEALLEAGGPLA